MYSYCFFWLLLACLTSTVLSSVDNATFPLWLCVVGGALAKWGLYCTNQQFYFTVFHWSVSTIVEWPCNGLYRNSVNTPLGVCKIGMFVGTMGCPLYYCTTESPWWKLSLSVNPRANIYSFGVARWSLYILDYYLFSFATTESWFAHLAMRKSK